MDISQIQIKINQTSLADSGKTNSNKQTDPSANSFNQVLAMFNLFGHVSEKQGEANIQAENEVSNSNIDPAEIEEEELQQLDSLLTVLVELIQPLQQSKEMNDTEITGTSSQPFVSSSPLNQLQQNADDIGQELVQWLQKVNGLNESSINDVNQLMQKLAKLMSDIKTNEKNTSIEVHNNIEEKLQFILNEFDDIKQKGSNETNLLLSLDKNLVLFSPASSRNITNNENVRISPDQVDDPVNSNGPVLISNDQQLQGAKGWNTTKEQQPLPTITVNDFVPEVSDFAGRYLRIINNQNGSMEAKFLLSPDHLGQIEVKLTVQNGEVSAQILADTTIAKEALEAQLQQLKQALIQQGLTVQKLDVVQQTPQAFDLNQNNQSQSFSHDGSNSSDKRQLFDDSSEKSSKKQQEKDLLAIDSLNFVETKIVSYGGAIAKNASQIDFTA